jgi:aldehyde:ferredoxin oxidoreductase
VKGIAFSGTQRTELADEALLKELINKIAQMSKGSPVTEVYRNLGTPSMVRLTNSNQCFPTRYWSSGYHEQWENLCGEYMREHFHTQARACPPCLLRCTKFSTISTGRHTGLELEGPEYETIYSLGGLNELDSLEEVAYLNDLCDRLGIDTISAGNLAGLATEAYKRGMIDFQIDYNQPERIAELFQLIARRQGVGELLAEGMKKAAQDLDLEDIAVHVKGLEPAGFDPRVLKGMGLSYATAARGACHLRGTFYKPELSREIEPSQIKDKARLLVDYEDRAALFDCMILCRFYRDFIKWEELAQLIRATTGLDWSKEQLQTVANTITQDTRRFNAREGLDRASDCVPPRLLDQPNAQGATLTTDEITALIEDYNRLRGG